MVFNPDAILTHLFAFVAGAVLVAFVSSRDDAQAKRVLDQVCAHRDSLKRKLAKLQAILNDTESDQ